MKRLLLLALPTLLAGCPGPHEAADQGTPIATEARAASAPAAAPTATDAAAPTPPADNAPAAAPSADTLPATAAAADAATSAAAATSASDAPPASSEFAEVAMIRAAVTLTKRHWLLADARNAAGQRIDALLVRPAQPVTLDFKGGQLSVGNTCNPISGKYLPSGKSILVSALASTRKACVDAKLMALDAEVGKRLDGKLGLRLSKQDPLRLELRNAAGDVMVFDSRPAANNPAAAKDKGAAGATQRAAGKG